MPGKQDWGKVETRLSRRSLKERVGDILVSKDLEDALEDLKELPPRRAVNPLFSLLYSREPELKWKAVAGMGMLVDRLARADIESARVVLRRLMWNLNDESGGIGWGSAEAMGEVLANNAQLAHEYSSVLISYAREDGNFQEMEAMQRGVLWGIGRMAQVRPYLVRDSVGFLLPFVDSKDPAVRGLAVWVLGLSGPSGSNELTEKLQGLLDDDAEFSIYLDRKLVKRRIKDIASQSLERLSSIGGSCFL